MAETPTLNRIRDVHEDSQKIGEFIDWLCTQGYAIAYYPKGEETRFDQRLSAIPKSTEQLLAEYFEIDLNQAEKERRAILDEIRNK
jgi:hypothetical protein